MRHFSDPWMNYIGRCLIIKSLIYFTFHVPPFRYLYIGNTFSPIPEIILIRNQFGMYGPDVNGLKTPRDRSIKTSISVGLVGHGDQGGQMNTIYFPIFAGNTAPYLVYWGDNQWPELAKRPGVQDPDSRETPRAAWTRTEAMVMVTSQMLSVTISV